MRIFGGLLVWVYSPINDQLLVSKSSCENSLVCEIWAVPETIEDESLTYFDLVFDSLTELLVDHERPIILALLLCLFGLIFIILPQCPSHKLYREVLLSEESLSI